MSSKKKLVVWFLIVFLAAGFLYGTYRAPALLFLCSKESKTNEFFLRIRTEVLKKQLEDYLDKKEEEYGYSFYRVFYEHIYEYPYQEEYAIIWLDAIVEEEAELMTFGKNLSIWLDEIVLKDPGLISNRPSVWILIDAENDGIPEIYFMRNTSGGPIQIETGIWESEIGYPGE